MLGEGWRLGKTSYHFQYFNKKKRIEMKTLQINEKEAKKIYKTASQELKQVLEDTFGKEFFSETVTERIKSVEDAFNETGRPKIDFSIFPEDIRSYMQSHYELAVLTEALNEGEKFDYDNENQRKYCSWWEKSPSGFVFSDSGYYYTTARAGSGVRLCLKNEELVRHAASIAPHLYNGILNS